MKRCETVDSTSAAELWLRPASNPDGRELVDEFAASAGERVGVDALLRDLSHRAVGAKAPAPAASYGFRWNLLDSATLRWWPQGITTSADAAETGVVGDRELVIVSWYAKKFRGRSLGVRLSFIDVTDRERPTYRHVLLVEAVRDDQTGAVQPRLVHVHAGGIAWHGTTIWVTDTYGGFRLFDVRDLLRLSRVAVEGYRYVLPQRSSYDAVAEEGTQRFRFSFVSLDRTGPVPGLVAGEYGGADAARRLARFPIDPVSGRLVLSNGAARPVEVSRDGPQRMQGAVSVGGRHYLATSNGRWHRGTLWSRQGHEAPQPRGSVLAVGPEDLAYSPQRDELWNVTEHPLRRYVYAVPRAQFG